MNCRQQRRSTAVLGVEKSRAAAMAPVSTAGPHAERDPRVFSKLLPSHPDALLGNTVRCFVRNTDGFQGTGSQLQHPDG